MPGSISRSLILLLILSPLFFIGTPEKHSRQRSSKKSTSRKPVKASKRTQMAKAWEQEFNRTRDPELGRIPRHRIIKAYEYAEEKRLLLQRARAIPGVEWKERGPDNYGGRSRTILVDPNDLSNKSVFAASVSGGLWKTTDITAEQPVWNSVNDFFSNIAISTLAYNPANTMEMYFGSGEGLGGPENIVEGNGIWKSTDGGATFTQLASTITDDRITCAGAGFCDFQFVNKIVVTAGGIVLAATNGAVYDDSGGIMRSTDGGTNWTRVLDGFNGNNVCTGVDYRDWAADLEIAANGDIYAAFGVSSNNGIWKSTDNGATWNNVYASACDEYRIELAVAPSDANYVYAMVARNDDALNKVMRTTNGGGLWTTLTLPIWTDVDCTTNNDITNGQAYYDLAIAVDPADRDEVWIGGIDLHRSSNGGTTWTQLTQWDGQCAMQEVHADQHLIYFQPGSSDIIYFANDGGIYRTENGSATSPTYKRKEFNYNTSQYYSVALHPTAGVEHMIGGTQDNGSTILTKFGKSSAIEVTGGDGAFSHIDQSDPLYQFTAFPEITLARSTNGGNNFDFVDIGYEGGQFINPSDYDDDLNLYYCSYEPDRYIVSDDMTAANPNFYDETIGAFGGGMITAVTVSEIEADVVYFGLDNGGVVRVTDASGEFLAPSGADITPAGVPFNVSVSCIAQDINDADHLVVTYSNYGTTSVYETLDGGNNWDDIEGDLPDMPVRWALFNPNDPDQLLLATEVGVWSTDLIDGVNTEWEPSNNGLANVRTDMLAIRNSDNLVAAATHGRGIFTSDIFAVANAEFTTDRTVVYAEQPVQFDDASYKSTSWSWDFGDGGVSSQQNPQHSFANPGYYTVSLEINGAITETKNNYILVLPNLGTPYTLADGGNFETNPDHFGSDIVRGNINLWERGTPTNQLTTVSSGTNAWKTDLDADITRADYNCALYSPTYNMTAAGTYSLSFQKSMETTSTSEPIGIQVQYTIDRGQNWIRLGSENDPDGTNWFDRGATTSGIETKIIWDRTGFLDNYNNENTAYDISFLAGNTDVAFRIVFYSDADELFNPAGFNVDGFMIDDFQITGPVNEPNINISDPVPGFAIEMDGTDDYVNLEDFSLPNSFSTTFWIDAQSTADGQIFLAKHDAAGNDLFTVGFRNGGIEAGLGVQSVNTGNKSTGLQHIAVTVNDVGGGNSQVTIYKDGNLEVQQTIADVLGTTTGLPWVVGQDWDGIGVGSEFFDGSMDELTFWSKVLTEEEIRTQMNIILEGSESSLVDYWQFNEGAGTSTTGAITSNTGTLISGPTWINSLIPCGPGTSIQLNVSADGTYNFTGTDLSIEFNNVAGGGFDIAVSKLSTSPSGTQPEDDNALVNNYKDPYWVINKFDNGTFSDATLTYVLGGGVITETDPAKIILLKRGSTESGPFALEAIANSVNTGTGTVIFPDITTFSQTTLGTVLTPLPVEYLNIEARWNQRSESVWLNWRTASEVNNLGFEIERSIDTERWNKIGELPGRINSSRIQSYNFEDKEVNQSGSMFYRLKQIDLDGQYNYSPIVSVDIPVLAFLKVELSGNPVRSGTRLIMESQADTELFIQTFDLSGKKLMQELVEVRPGKQSIPFDKGSLNSGIYLLRVTGNGYSKTIRFLVAR